MYQPDPHSSSTVESLRSYVDIQLQKLATELHGFDYETGNWTPVLSDGTNNATSSVAVGTYVKIGRAIYFKGRLALSSLGSVTGDIRITGLPYNSDSTTNSDSAIYVGYASSLSITAGQSIAGRVEPGQTYISLQLADAATGTTAMQASEWTANGDVIFSGFYFIRALP